MGRWFFNLASSTLIFLISVCLLDMVVGGRVLVSTFWSLRSTVFFISSPFFLGRQTTCRDGVVGVFAKERKKSGVETLKWNKNTARELFKGRTVKLY